MRSAHGSIQELDKGKRYRITVEAGRDPKTGKRVRETRTVRGSRKKAEQVKGEMLAALGNTEYAREQLTLDEFFHGMYLPNCRERGLRPGTVAGYEAHYSQLVDDHMGRFLLSSITPIALNRWLAGIDGQKKKAAAYKLMRQVLNRAVKWDLLDANPCARVEAPKAERYRPDVLSADDAAAYLHAFRGTTVETAVLLALGGGFRRSEIVALDWEDVTPDGVVSVSKGITSVAGKAHLDAPKTEFSERRVHLPSFASSRLNELRRASGPVCADADGNRYNPDAMTRAYIRIRDAMGEDVKRVPFKNLRHTSLSLAIESGTDLLAVSRRAGHANVGITAAYYLRPSEEIDKAAADRLDGLFSRKTAR